MAVGVLGGLLARYDMEDGAAESASSGSRRRDHEVKLDLYMELLHKEKVNDRVGEASELNLLVKACCWDHVARVPQHFSAAEARPQSET